MSPLRLIVKQGDGKPEAYEAVPAFTPSASELSSCVGPYYSEEIEPVYVMEIDEGKLALHRLKNKPDTLRPITRDLFAGSVGIIRFKRNAQGQVSGFVLNGDRVRNSAVSEGIRPTRKTLTPDTSYSVPNERKSYFEPNDKLKNGSDP